MGDKTGISWCDATFNPWWVHEGVSPACDRLARCGDAHWRRPLRWAETMPAKLRRRPRVCAIMADWLHIDAHIAEFVRLLDTIRLTPELDWLLLSKPFGRRFGHALSYCASVDDAALDRRCEPMRLWETRLFAGAWLDGSPPANVWVGATVVNQAEADRDIPKLLAVPARVRFVSIEPMLGPIDLRLEARNDIARWDALGRDLPLRRIDWVICGGASGPNAPPMYPDWPQSLRDQCAAAGVPFNFTQWGEWLPTMMCDDDMAMLPSKRTVFISEDGTYAPLGPDYNFFGSEEETSLVGTRAAGRTLDGMVHDAFPEVHP